jgi:hypothetical protein
MVQVGVVLAPLFAPSLDAAATSPETLALIAAFHFWGNGVIGLVAWAARDPKMLSGG